MEDELRGPVPLRAGEAGPLSGPPHHSRQGEAPQKCRCQAESELLADVVCSDCTSSPPPSQQMSGLPEDGGSDKLRNLNMDINSRVMRLEELGQRGEVEGAQVLLREVESLERERERERQGLVRDSSKVSGQVPGPSVWTGC